MHNIKKSLAAAASFKFSKLYSENLFIFYLLSENGEVDKQCDTVSYLIL